MRGKSKKKAVLSEDEITALKRKVWLGCKDVSRLLMISESKVKMLWLSGRLIFNISPDKRGTRKSSFKMVEDYKKREMKY